MTWLIDTNIAVFCLRGTSPTAMRRLSGVPAAAVGVSLQVYAELMVGVAIRTQLESIGMPIGEADLWIAATARAAGGTLITNDTGEFSRVPNLVIEDWTLP